LSRKLQIPSFTIVCTFFISFIGFGTLIFVSL